MIFFFLFLLSQYSPNIALEAYVIKAAGFTGMTCTVFQKVATSDRTGLNDYGRRDPDGNLDKQLSFKCNVSNTLSSLALKVVYSLFPYWLWKTILNMSHLESKLILFISNVKVAFLHNPEWLWQQIIKVARHNRAWL